jgi:hypothetical protein
MRGAGPKGRSKRAVTAPTLIVWLLIATNTSPTPGGSFGGVKGEVLSLHSSQDRCRAAIRAPSNQFCAWMAINATGKR